MTKYNKKILVSGASGRLAIKALEELLDVHGIPGEQIIATSRTPDKLASFKDRGVAVRYADFNEPHSLNVAFAGAKKALLIPTLSVDVPGKRLKEHTNAVEAFAKAGVEHVVQLSFVGFGPKSPIQFAPDYYRPAQLVKEKGMALTLMEDNWYMNNWELYIPTILARGKWPTCTQGFRANQVERQECARATAAVLAQDGHEGQTYVICGPQALTVREMADIVGDVFNKGIEIEELSDEQYYQYLLAYGEPPLMASGHFTFEVNIRNGGQDVVTDDVKKLTGRDPMSFREYLELNRDKFPEKIGYGHPWWQGHWQKTEYNTT